MFGIPAIFRLLAPLVVLALTSGCSPSGGTKLTAAQRGLAGDLSNERLAALSASFDPSVRMLAVRHDPFLRRADPWSRPEGWTSLDIREPPSLGFSTLDGAAAQQLNDLRPFANLPIRPMKAFVLQAAADERARALDCLSKAVYYEAAREPREGQEAVAQVVLNRLRHPAYPKSVCGVVFQGSARVTGCQFTFTCDGSLRWAPEPALWRRARDVAERALNGFVDRRVGSATHYHASYVAPYWAPTLVKMTKVGQHIFYRWTGPWGEPAAFTGRYAGGEAYLSPNLLTDVDERTQGGLLAPETQDIPPERKVTLAVAGEVRTYTVADPLTADGERTRVMGVIRPTRRQPTPDEIRAINESLAKVEAEMDARGN